MRESVFERRRKKAFVIIDMLIVLVTGGVINVSDTADRENLSVKTINRYIDEINNYLESKRTFVEQGVRVNYNKKSKGYALLKRNKYFIKKEEIYFICKLIFADKNLSKYLKSIIIKKLLVLLDENSRNEVYSGMFDEIMEKKDCSRNDILEKMWELTQCTVKQYKVEIITEGEEMEINPLAVIFFHGEKYIIYSKYINMSIDDTILYSEKIENIRSIKVLEKRKKRNIGYFNTTEFLKYFNGGRECELIRIRFRYYGNKPEIIKKDFPAFEYSKSDEFYLFYGKTFKEGFLNRIMKFGVEVEVIEPKVIRDEIIRFIKEMGVIYRECK